MRTKVLLLCAEPPDADGLGGVQIHTGVLSGCDEPDAEVVVAYVRGGALCVEQRRPRSTTLARLPISATDDPLAEGPAFRSALEAAVVGTQADVLHIHSPELWPTAVAKAIDTTRIPVIVTLHHHALACENFTLLEGGERFCGLPSDAARCDRCLGVVLGQSAGRLERWRAALRHLVDRTTLFVAPSNSVLHMAERVHPGIGSRTRRVDWGVPSCRFRCVPSNDVSRPLRVGVVGLQARVKGIDLLPTLIAACRDLSVEWHLFGATEGASQRRLRRAASRVVTHGAYRRRALPRLLAQAHVDLAVLPSVAPESFSLTLSEVLSVGLPVIASHWGALGERVERHGAGWLFDPWQPASLRERLGVLSKDRGTLIAAASRAGAAVLGDESAMVRAHVALWWETAQKASGVRAAAITEEALDRFSRAAAGVSGKTPWWVRALAELRRTSAYRDLRLRRVLSSRVRRSVEQRLSSTFSKGTR